MGMGTETGMSTDMHMLIHRQGVRMGMHLAMGTGGSATIVCPRNWTDW